MNTISILCIPRMETKIKKDYIFNIFRRLDIGNIEKITELPLRIDPQFKCIQIKIKWNDTQKAKDIQARLDAKLPVNIVYDEPWYWKLVTYSPESLTR